jgi:hypothetical protein
MQSYAEAAKTLHTTCQHACYWTIIKKNSLPN